MFAFELIYKLNIFFFKINTLTGSNFCLPKFKTKDNLWFYLKAPLMNTFLYYSVIWSSDVKWNNCLPANFESNLLMTVLCDLVTFNLNNLFSSYFFLGHL